ncbi:MAG: TonB-dependent receptor plug domain-containing protein, partial [Bacteroidota bacterium]
QAITLSFRQNKMINAKRHIYSITLVFFFGALCFGQTEQNSLALKIILKNIEQQHHVRFNYNDDEVFGHSILPPPASMPLKAKLVYIQNRTLLGFTQIKKYIVVYKPPVPVKAPLCGFVTDELGMPLDNAIVQYDGRKLATGSDGYFELPPNTPSPIYVAHNGYVQVLVAPENPDGDCQKIILQLESLPIDEIVTERYLATGISKKADGSFDIKPKKFGILPGLIEPDVLQAMQQLPGINSVDETVSNINVRGGTHDQNLFMWNGIRLFQTGHFFGLISALNPNLAHDIRISKNGTSAYYGESVSSAVDISSRLPEIGATNGSIASNMIGVDAYAKVKASEKANFEVTARRSFTDVLDFPTYSNYSKRIFQNTVVTALDDSNDVNYKSDKEFYFYDFTLGYHQKIGKRHDLYTDVIGINNNLDFTQGTITATDVVTEQSSLKQHTYGATAAWRTRWNEGHSSEVGLYGSYYGVDGRNSSIEYNQVTEQQNTIQDAGFRVTDHYDIDTRFTVHTGYQYNEIGIKNTDRVNEPQYSRQIKDVLRTHALFAEAEYHPQESKLFARAGLRGNYIEQFAKIYAEPRLQVTYAFAPGFKLEVLGEQKSQSLSQVVELQGDFLGIEKRRWILANNTDIPIQRSNQVSAGITFKQNGWLLTLDNFYKKIKGITTLGQAFQDQLEEIQATGSYTVIGSEFLVQKQFGGFYAWLSYTFNNNNYRFDGVEPEHFPSSFEISHMVKSAAIYEFNNVKIALGSKWFTGRPFTPPLLSIPTFDNNGQPAIAYNYPNSENLANFLEVDFSASYTLQLTQKATMQVGLSILNIFDRKNIINRYYRINTNNGGIEMVNTYALERTPNALVKISF